MLIHTRSSVAALIGLVATVVGSNLAAQNPMRRSMPEMEHAMARVELGSGWRLVGMAQLFPIVTVSDPGGDDINPTRATGWYLTQPAVMANLESPDSRFVLRTTLNFEGVTQEDGELTSGGWGEGFLDKRHPHTLLHEAMLSVNVWSGDRTAFSVSAGKGFAPYGTDDPMSRPGLKYPTNHHLSQILERWTLNGVFTLRGWSLEAGLFGGGEPEGPYDFSNISSFGDSWSARVGRRWGPMGEPQRWELTASYGRVREEHGGGPETMALMNGTVRFETRSGPLGFYTLAEGSRSDPEDGEGFFSVLVEARLDASGHQPYLRIERAIRPEFTREGPAGTVGFFRYDHDAEPIGATSWWITTLAYAFEATRPPWSVRPFVELQHHAVGTERGGIVPATLLGTESFWSLSLGARLYLGGGPMRMGSYGVLDAMTRMERSMAGGMVMPMGG